VHADHRFVHATASCPARVRQRVCAPASGHHVRSGETSPCTAAHRPCTSPCTGPRSALAGSPAPCTPLAPGLSSSSSWPSQRSSACITPCTWPRVRPLVPDPAGPHLARAPARNTRRQARAWRLHVVQDEAMRVAIRPGRPCDALRVSRSRRRVFRRRQTASPRLRNARFRGSRSPRSREWHEVAWTSNRSREWGPGHYTVTCWENRSTMPHRPCLGSSRNGNRTSPRR
jgi:hypothetical protein